MGDRLQGVFHAHRPQGGLPVRPRRRVHSMVRVHVGVSQDPVVEGNCVAAKRGGEQPEANWRCAVKRTRFGRVWRRADWEKAKPETHRMRCFGG